MFHISMFQWDHKQRSCGEAMGIFMPCVLATWGYFSISWAGSQIPAGCYSRSQPWRNSWENLVVATAAAAGGETLSFPPCCLQSLSLHWNNKQTPTSQLSQHPHPSIQSPDSCFPDHISYHPNIAWHVSAMVSIPSHSCHTWCSYMFYSWHCFGQEVEVYDEMQIYKCVLCNLIKCQTSCIPYHTGIWASETDYTS